MISNAKKAAALSAAVFLLVLLLSDSFFIENSKPVFISDEQANFAEFNKISKYKKAKEFYYPLRPLIITSNDQKNIINEESATFGFDNMTDIGIDTAIIKNDSLIVSIIRYSSFLDNWSLQVFTEDSVISFNGAGDSTIVLYPLESPDSVLLLCSDDNSFNQAFKFEKGMKILILSSSYSPALQNLSLSLSLLIDSVLFSTGIYRNGRISSIYKDFSGVILIGNAESFDSIIPSERLNYPELTEENFNKVASLTSRVVKKSARIKNPFSPKNRIQEGALAQFSENIKSNPLKLLSFLGYAICLILLF
ncbi:MAG: hypothetical protein PHW02_08895 [bacterium]|nr:hypothetical protein [bacterium]